MNNWFAPMWLPSEVMYASQLFVWAFRLFIWVFSQLPTFMLVFLLVADGKIGWQAFAFRMIMKPWDVPDVATEYIVPGIAFQYVSKDAIQRRKKALLVLALVYCVGILGEAYYALRDPLQDIQSSIARNPFLQCESSYLPTVCTIWEATGLPTMQRQAAERAVNWEQYKECVDGLIFRRGLGLFCAHLR